MSSLRFATFTVGLLAGSVGGSYLAANTFKRLRSSHDTQEQVISVIPEARPNTLEEFRERFLKHAQVDENGERYISPSEFVASILYQPPDAPVWAATPRKHGKKRSFNEEDPSWQELFRLADSDGNGKILFQEYAMFLTLLTSPQQYYKVSFQMFDKDGDGMIDVDEFKQVMEVGAGGPLNIKNNAMVNALFGSQNKVSLARFTSFVNRIRELVLRQEFLMYDIEGNGLIHVEAFSELMTRKVHRNSPKIDEFKRHLNILKTNGFFRPTGRIDFDTFLAFNKITDHLPEISESIRIYATGPRGIQKADFARALRNVAGLKVSPKVVDIIYGIFDRNGDGSLEIHEFLSIMGKRASSQFLPQTN